MHYTESARPTTAYLNQALKLEWAITRVLNPMSHAPTALPQTFGNNKKPRFQTAERSLE